MVKAGGRARGQVQGSAILKRLEMSMDPHNPARIKTPTPQDWPELDQALARAVLETPSERTAEILDALRIAIVIKIFGEPVPDEIVVAQIMNLIRAAEGA